MKTRSYISSFMTVFFVACFFYNSQAQNYKRIAELHHDFKIAKTDSAKITALTKLANKYVGFKIDSTLKYANKAIKIAYNSKRGKGIAYAYNLLGDAYWYKSDFRKAQEFYFKAYRVSDSINDKSVMALSLYSMGYIYCIQQKDLSKLNYLYKSANIFSQTKNKSGLSTVYNALSLSYIESFRYNLDNKVFYDSALYYNDLSKKIDVNKKSILINYFSNLIKLQYYANDYKSAIFYSEKLFFINKNDSAFINDVNDAELYSIFCKINLNKKELNTLQKIDRLYNVYVENTNKEQVSLCNRAYAEYYYSINDYKKAYEYGLKYFSTQQELEKIIHSTQMDNLKNNYETGKTQNKLDELEKAKELETQKNKTKNYLLIAVFAGILTVLGFVYSLRKQNLQKQTANKLLEDKNHIIEEKQKEILDSINYAKRIQDSLLASSELIKKYFPNNFVYFNPKDIVSGDFYWAAEHNNCLYLAVCDSTGHGVPGAFMSFLNMAYLSEAISEKNISEPHNILNYVRTRLINTISKEGQSDGMDGILFKIEKTDTITKIEYAAANNHPLLITNNQLLEQPKDKMPIGKGEKYDSFSSHSIAVKTGDAIYLYTDGYADQFGGEKGKKFKYKPLNELLLSSHHLPMQKQKEILSHTFNSWKGNLEQIDDVLIFGIVI